MSDLLDKARQGIRHMLEEKLGEQPWRGAEAEGAPLTQQEPRNCRHGLCPGMECAERSTRHRGFLLSTLPPAFLLAGADIASAREQGALGGALASFAQADEMFSQEPRWHRLAAEPR